MKLYPHQVEGASWLRTQRRAMLLDEQGLGKTITAIDAAAQVHFAAPISYPVLVVCPSVVLWNWEAEFADWAPWLWVQVVDKMTTVISPRADVVIVTHGLLLAPLIQAQLLRLTFLATVLDEAHFFRGPEAHRVATFYGLGRRKVRETIVGRSRRVWLLTGTPIPNDASELWTHLRGLWPERIRNEVGQVRSFESFRGRYCKVRRTEYNGWKILGNKNLGELKDKLKGLSLRRRMADVLPDIPSIRYEIVTLRPRKMPTEIERIDRELRPHVRQVLYNETIPEQGFSALRGEVEFAAYRRLCGLAKVEPVVELVQMEQEGGLDKIVIFAHHTAVIDELEQAFGPEQCIKIVGATPAKKRHAQAAAFNEDPKKRVALLNVIAGGTGVSLPAAHEVLFAEASFVPGENDQAAKRCRRMVGTTEKVRCRFVALAGTVDADVMRSLRRKTQMIREVIE